MLMDIDLGTAYRAARLRVADLVDDNLSDRPVPATPLWCMHDVVAHLAGVMNDIVSGNMEGAATPPWTAAQVERGRDKTVGQVIDEWADGASSFESFLSSPTGPKAGSAMVDVHAHETDMRTALGLEPAVPDEVVAWVAERLREGFDSQVVAAGLPPVTIDVSDFEMFRGRLGRRTREQVSAFGWSADPTPYLDTFFLFGPTDHPVGT
jgi:uncharacterized protein (TIGR03083 family)